MHVYVLHVLKLPVFVTAPTELYSNFLFSVLALDIERAKKMFPPFVDRKLGEREREKRNRERKIGAHLSFSDT